MINKNYIVQGFIWLLSGISAFATPIITTDAKDVPVNAQQPVVAGFVVHNSNAFYAAPGSIASSTKVIVLDNPTANVQIAQLHPTNQVSKAVCVQTPTKQRKHTHKTTTATTEVEKPIAQKTVITCPFGTTSNNGNIFAALHNSAGIIPPTTSRKIGTSYLQRSGEFHTSKKFTSKYFIQTSPSAPLQRRREFSQIANLIGYRSLLLWREVRGEDITTRPPPING
jgi:hypothetical protein